MEVGCEGDSQPTDEMSEEVRARLFQTIEDMPLRSPLELFRKAAAIIRHELIDLNSQYSQAKKTGPYQPSPSANSYGSTPTLLQGASESPGVSDRLAAWTAFHQSVERLTDADREMFDLLWYHGLEQVEASVLLDIPDPIVKRRWMAARLRLQEVFHGALPDA